MSRWVIDSSVTVDHLRGHAEATRVLGAALEEGTEFWSSCVVRTEIWAGSRAKEEQSIGALFAQLRWQAVDEQIADRAGALARRYIKSHSGIDTADYLVAATAIVLVADLKTQNIKHFPMFDKLRRAYPV